MDAVIIEKEMQRLSYNSADQTIHEEKWDDEACQWIWQSSFPLSKYWVEKLGMYAELADMIKHRAAIKVRPDHN